MITVISAQIARGYSPRDHLINDRCLAPLIGRDFETLEAAFAAARELQKGDDAEGPARLEYAVGDEVRTATDA